MRKIDIPIKCQEVDRGRPCSNPPLVLLIEKTADGDDEYWFLCNGHAKEVDDN